jgi:hypothetical protein
MHKLNKKIKHSPHQQFWRMATALHWWANQFCEVNLSRNVLQNPQNFLRLKTLGNFHLGWKKKIKKEKEKDNALTIVEKNK